MSTPANADGVFLDGPALVVPHEFRFPHVCLVTGHPADSASTKLKLRRIGTSEGLGGVPSVFKLLAQALVKMEADSATTEVFLNQSVLQRRRNLLIAQFAVVPVGFGLTYLLLKRTDQPIWFILVPISIVATLLLGWFRSRIFDTPKITTSYIWMTGVHPQALELIYHSRLKQ